MSLVEALQALSRQAHDPGVRQERAAEERESWRRVIARHGSAEAVMAAGPEEEALVSACRPFVEAGRLDPDFAPEVEAMDAGVAAAVREAFPFPGTVAGLLEEHRRWSQLSADRFVVSDGVMQPVALDCRRRLLERALDEVPACGFADIEARLSWMGDVLDLDFARDARMDARCLATLREDVRRLAAREIALP